MEPITLVKPIWKKSIINGQKFCEMSLLHKKFGRIYTDVTSDRWITSEIHSSIGQLMAKEQFSIDSQKKTFIGEHINTMPCFMRNYLGELLRLVSIMIMRENELNSIDIVSIKRAIYFHSKYKFKPNIEDCVMADILMGDIVENENIPQLSKLAKAAYKVSREFETGDLDIATKKANEIVSDFIDVAQNIRNSTDIHDLTTNIKMQLSNETVEKNKAFFNELYKKHGIDYKI